MGGGKLGAPGQEGAGGQGDSTDAAWDQRGSCPGDDGLTTAELFAELVYSRIPLKEIAGLTDLQLVWIYARRRDEQGRLVKPGRPYPDRQQPQDSRDSSEDDCPKITKVVSLEAAFREAKRIQSFKFKGRVFQGKVFEGYTEDDIDALWERYLDDNPQLRQWLDRKDRSKREKHRRKANRAANRSCNGDN